MENPILNFIMKGYLNFIIMWICLAGGIFAFVNGDLMATIFQLFFVAFNGLLFFLLYTWEN